MSIPTDVARRLLDAAHVAETEEPVRAQAPAPRTPVASAPPPASAASRGAPPLPAPPPMSIEDMTLALTALSGKINETRQRMSINEIKGNMAKQSAENKERLAKIQESIEKADQAKKSGVWGKVFGWVAAVAAVVASAVMIATGVGAAAGALLLAGAITGLSMMVLKEIPAVADWMSKNPAFGWAMIAVQMVLAVASFGAGFAGAAKAVADVAAKTVGAATKVANVVGKVANGVQGGASVGMGASAIGTAARSYQASEANIDAKQIESELLKLQGLMDEEMARLKKMMQEAEESVSICMGIMSGATQAKRNIAAKMAV
ncbi:type III secretion system translocon subunit SctE [Imhoffiella purpurea]|uniref:Translocator protein BipB-like C-terminal domain-containing protein n=1 Tax=Imhoffiella purpurea TaxID=1249627 RepID=W9VHY0_9GAMM|nr:type III secretion system translocon subunit SctE [Imhoffiella purpurea]EXJ15657.1 hypothetical protein D779_1164 [Imhoffiella purpurea]